MKRWRRIQRFFVLGAVASLLGGIVPNVAHADVAVRELAARFPRAYHELVRSTAPRRVLARTRTLKPGEQAVELPNGLSAVALRPGDEQAEAFWAPPRRLLMDRVAETIGVSGYREQLVTTLGVGAGTGRGVVVGIADSGVDLTHPDLRDATGASRVAWLLALGTPAAGFHADLEQTFGCDSEELPCAVLAQAELDALIEKKTLETPNGTTLRLPRDVLGHGTHVASIAAGAGVSDARYTGVAPEATLVVVQVSASEASVDDAAIALGARFIYERGEALGLPVVLNLSLGGDFGPHDGTSALSSALVGFLDRPGRALVVSAGNSGQLLSLPKSQGGPALLGIHRRLRVVEAGSSAPLFLPTAQGAAEGAIFIWISGNPGETFSVGVDDALGKPYLRAVAAGSADSAERERFSVTVVNQATEYESTLSDIARGAAVLIQGQFNPEDQFVLRLSGDAQASLWVQSQGGLGPEAGSPGALFDNAQREGTITIPADAPEFVAVGATLNRVNWPGRDSSLIELDQFDPDLDLTLGSPAFFSSLGPTVKGRLKPDLLAPGGLVVAALSAAADPALSTGLSLFASPIFCTTSPGCAVVDGQHAVTLGTSMAAPIAAGAAALLLERNPGLTQAEVLGLLQASAVRAPGSLSPMASGIGTLFLPRVADAAERADSATSEPLVPDATASWIVFSDTALEAGGRQNVEALVRLRTADDAIADPPQSDLTLSVRNAKVHKALKRRAPGLYAFTLNVEDSQEGELRVALSYQGASLLKSSLPLTAPVQARLPSSDSGCGVAGHGRTPKDGVRWAAAVLVGLALCARRQRRGTNS